MDYDIFYKGKIIGNIQAGSDAEAQKNATLIYGGGVTTERV